MPYTIGDRRITLDSNLLESDKQLLITHPKIFKYCLNNAVFRYIINLKNLVHLYSDIITIYATLLRKIPHYDDVTLMTNKSKLNLLKLEHDFNDIFGQYTTMLEYKKFKSSWEDISYEGDIVPSALLIIDVASQAFGTVYKSLSCIELFFKHYDNLKKLLIPSLVVRTKSVLDSFAKLEQFLKLSFPVDKMARGEIITFDESTFENMRRVEKVTSGIERESIILETVFLTFDGSLKQYTSILLGKAILKRDVAPRDCEIISRRGICYQAAEHVVTIPLSEDSPNKSKSAMEYLSKYIAYIGVSLLILISVVFYRLFKVLFG
ncbi:conserved hypothetical protein [Candida dubliniensis CD36]|uniref:Uncharacterized protein n=1 Tax=Candida dubliniensis (strain CD36 / ATCC MYA-646 / CBS 7987 / NCPF 3949 / NRRL Y-17841) TaxID=573826 RepID=B9WE07_CANDC|nr:conserved hypothetical protein [Candida dubliniensis CD36]CAX42917.1 conserved hypothetical protein [Candida dubliniensis CD36]